MEQIDRVGGSGVGSAEDDCLSSRVFFKLVGRRKVEKKEGWEVYRFVQLGWFRNGGIRFDSYITIGTLNRLRRKLNVDFRIGVLSTMRQWKI